MFQYQNKKMPMIQKGSCSRAVIVLVLIAVSTTTTGVVCARIPCNMCDSGFQITNLDAQTTFINQFGVKSKMTCNKLNKMLKKGVTKKICKRQQAQERKQLKCDCKKCFENTLELKDAAFEGYSDNAFATGLRNVTSIYGPIEHWCVDKINQFSYVFAINFGNFNEDISRWRTSKATSMQGMFFKAYNFNADLSKWDVGRVENMNSMFFLAQKFNSNIAGWNVKEVTDMDSMFSNAINFNSDLSEWDVGKVIYLGSMFESAVNFDSDISVWNVKEVIDMSAMFYKAYNFNSDLSKWNVSKVVHMGSMFESAEKFNSNISGWNVSNVEYFDSMFRYASAFNQNLCKWKMKMCTKSALGMLEYSGCPSQSNPNCSSNFFCQACV
jgi:surface protein